ncbi:tRNA-specific adenosine deaminase 1 [Episyrphus balteatus]|uniref:tRNA-specific adenosine deaminase 1 n=1 Tax=Episyrphus balteatus TaxID=286459 RepID=UPI002485E00A|nr:tRNA-specific adenosine deaminase 1 [Episyrphus balteatus]
MQPKNLANSFAEITFKKFNSLPKTGKPTKSEWTVLSSIIQVDNSQNGETKVVALGCGTKCIGKSKLCPFGLILNDSHAEVLARRGFLRYIYHQLKSRNDLITYDETKYVFRIKGSISFHFFTTQVPCGDACIASEPIENCNEIPNKRIKLDDNKSNAGDVLNSSKVFTGAKLIGNHESDPMNQVQGSLRTKPGRGDRTLSMSCSDKLSKWNILGVQGALLDMILEKPIYLESLNFSCQFDMNSMQRAIYGRWKEREFKSNRFIAQEPQIHFSEKCSFEFSQDPKKNASPNGLVWCDVPEDNGPYEISVNGKKQGITKKLLQTKKASLKISKLQLLEEFCEFVKSHSELKTKFILGEDDLESKTYRELKEMSQEYQDSWKVLKESYFQQWTKRPDNILDFNLLSCNKNS